MNPPIILPPLRPHEGSWAIIHQATERYAMELFKPDAHLAQRMNGAAYFARPIAEHLGMINQAIREGQALSADACPIAA